MTKAIQLDDVTVTLGGSTRLGPVSTTIGKSALTAIIGANGAGKTLLLRAIAGLETLTTGQMVINGVPRSEGARRQTMLMTQKPMFLHRSVYDNLAFPLTIRKMPKGEARKKIEQGLEQAELHDHKDQLASTLSGGEQQKLSLARALILDYPWLLLDEPTASLDVGATHNLEVMIARILKTGVKIILVSHNIGQVARLADDLLFLDHGKIAEQGEANACLKSPQSEALTQFLTWQGMS